MVIIDFMFEEVNTISILTMQTVSYACQLPG